MNKYIVLLSLCIATCTTALAQSEDEETLVYVSTGCNTSAASTYHSTRYCNDIKLCRHDHKKAEAKKCGDQCQHNGHVKSIDISKAESMGKEPCGKCCKELKKSRKKVKKSNIVEEDD